MKTNTFIKLKGKYFKLLIAIAIILTNNYICSATSGSVITVSYHSSTQNTQCQMNIYLPAGYDDVADSSNHYPVFYLFHGGGENYTYWVNAGFADTVLNYYISTGKCVPMILVMPDCKNIAPATFANEMLNDIIPYIESHYRVKADKDHRGVGGLSWGGMQALELGIYHYELFGYISSLSSGWFTTETATYDRAKSFLTAHAADMEKSIRYFYFAEGTSYDIAYNNGMATLKLFKDYNLTVHYWEYSGGHQWSVWKEDFKSFVPYLFRDSTTKYISLAFQGGRIKNSTIMTNLDSLAPAPEDPTRTGYSFSGWYKEPEYINSYNFSSDTIKSNITIYAKWNINSYKVSFNSRGGNYTPDTLLATYNTKVEEPMQPTKSGLYFGGWYMDTTYSQKWVFTSFPVTNDMTLFAKWSDYTSIKENQNRDLILYPNPAQTSLQIINLQSEADIDIINIEGKSLMHLYQVGSNDKINIEKLPSGIYYVVINGANNNYHLKLIKD
jgi:uncharacterized repeat protein (TIGR02543 family)